MVSGSNDAVECFFTSLNAVQSSFLQAAKDLEDKFPKFNNTTQHLDVEANKAASSSSSPPIRVPPHPLKSFLFNSSTSRCIGIENDIVKTKKHKHKHRKQNGIQDENCVDCCLHFAFLSWSVLSQGLLQAFPNPFKKGKKCRFHKNTNESTTPRVTHVSVKSQQVKTYEDVASQPAFPTHTGCVNQGANNLSLKLFVVFVFNHFLHKLDEGIIHTRHKFSSPLFDSDHLGIIKAILKGRQADVNCFLGNLSFARVGGAPQSMAGVTSVKDDDDREEVDNKTPLLNKEEPEGSSAKKIANGLLNIPLSNVDRLRSTLSSVSLTELIELLPQLGRPSNDYPDKKKLISVQDFFKYTESEGRRFFEELDRDGDGQVTLEDLEIAMRRRKLPQKYAREFMRRTKRHLFSKSFGWKQFLTLMEQKEPTILRAYTTLCLSKFGTLQKSQILTSLKNAGLPANEDNAVAMMRFLNADTEGSISYGHFRNFMLLLPSDRLEDDPRSIWFEAATVVAVPPPVEIPAGSVLKSALAGGVASALSTSFLYPVDTIKTRLQASTLSLPELMSKLPEIGVQGLYRGSIPAVLGQFSSHGLRTGIFEASRLVLINISPTLPEIQVQSISSFCSTFLGTAVRIPCEVLKQRLQAGMFNNVGEAIVGTYSRDGIRGFFRGTGATLCREVPFYVAGMGLYAESKKAVQHLLNRELEPWETIAVGALSGGLAAVVTTPFDVMKTRMMTAPQGVPVSMSMVAFSILRQEGPLGLFKGALPRFFWIAPLGAMNFAGYELARKAMDKELADDQISQNAT